MIVVVIEAELFPLLGSNVAELTVAVSIMALPIPAGTLITSVSVTTLLDASVGTLHVTVPVPPAAGAVQEPALTDALLNVAPAGIASTMLTLLAASGPLFITSIT